MSAAHQNVLAAALSEVPPRETYEIYDKCLGALVVRRADGAPMVAVSSFSALALRGTAECGRLPIIAGEAVTVKAVFV